MKQAAAVGGDRLTMVGAETKKGAQLVIASTGPLGGRDCVEAARTSDPTFDAPVILLEPVVLVGAGPMLHMPAECGADRTWVGIVPICGDAIRGHAGGGLGRAEERLGSRHVPLLAQHGIDQVAVTIDGAVGDRPPTVPIYSARPPRAFLVRIVRTVSPVGYLPSALTTPIVRSRTRMRTMVKPINTTDKAESCGSARYWT